MKLSRLGAFAFLIVLSASVWAEQQSGPVPAAAPAAANATAEGDVRASLKQRETAFYTALMGGDRNSAAQMVAPESRQEFLNYNLDALMAFTVDAVTVDPSGAKADVTVTRTFSPPYRMSIPWHDQWVNVDGQWYISIPKPSATTPFGDMTTKANMPPPNPEAMKRVAERRAKTVDPDQMMIQLQKYLKDHPDAIPPVEMQVPVPQTTIAMPQTGNAKTAPAAKTDAAASSDSSKTAKPKKNKKDPKHPDKQPDTVKH